MPIRNPEPGRPTHRLTVDVEDWFHAEAQASAVTRDAWENQRLRVLPNVLAVLGLLREFDVRATFFFLGWVAERLPDLVRVVAENGHEIACHSYMHRLVFKMLPQEFAADARRAKERIEKAGGAEVKGYRAPSFSIVAQSAWALEELARAGFHYDSSIFPIRHDTYGWPSAPKRPFRVSTAAGSIVEFPLTTARLWGQTLPAAGGGYLRIFPLWFTRKVLRAHDEAGEEAIVYFHPWEIDPRQPKSTIRGLSRFRHYTSLDRMLDKLRALLTEFRFGPLEESRAWQEPLPNFKLEAGARRTLSIVE